MKTPFIIVFILVLITNLLCEKTYCQQQKYHLLISGTIKQIDSVKTNFYGRYINNQIIICNLKILEGNYNNEEIIINVPCEFYISSCSNSVYECPNINWIGRNVLLEVCQSDNNYYSFGKCLSRSAWAPSLTRDRRTFYFISKENLAKDSIYIDSNDLLNVLDTVTQKIRNKDEVKVIGDLDKIIMDQNQYDFIKEWAIWKISEIQSKKNIYPYKSDLFSNYICNNNISLYGKLKAYWYLRNSSKDIYIDYIKVFSFFNELSKSQDQFFIHQFNSHLQMLINEINRNLIIQQSQLKDLEQLNIGNKSNPNFKYETVQHSNNKQNRLVLSGTISDINNKSVTLNNINLFFGKYDKEQITIELDSDVDMGFISPDKSSKPTESWKGLPILADIIFDGEKYFAKETHEKNIITYPFLTPNGHALFFVSKENIEKKNCACDIIKKFFFQIKNFTDILKLNDKEIQSSSLKDFVIGTETFPFIRKNAAWEYRFLNEDVYWIYELERLQFNNWRNDNWFPLELRIYFDKLLQPSFDNYKATIPFYFELYKSENTEYNEYAKQKLLKAQEYLENKIKIKQENIKKFEELKNIQK